MSLDVELVMVKETCVYESNITHNLNAMADALGIYKHLWRPEELGITKASELIEPLKEALDKMKADPEKYEEYNPENGWGDFAGFFRFVDRYCYACMENPEAIIKVDR